jgi:hypothetical protein
MVRRCTGIPDPGGSLDCSCVLHVMMWRISGAEKGGNCLTSVHAVCMEYSREAYQDAKNASGHFLGARTGQTRRAVSNCPEAVFLLLGANFWLSPSDFPVMTRATRPAILALVAACLVNPIASFLQPPVPLDHGKLIRKSSLGREPARAMLMQAHSSNPDHLFSRRNFATFAGALLLAPAWSSAKGPSMMNEKQALADKQALVDAIALIQGFEAKVKEPSSWQQIADVVTKPPYTKEAFDKLFMKASKTLPDNIQKIYGGDGGQWVGVKNEVRIFIHCHTCTHMRGHCPPCLRAVLSLNRYVHITCMLVYTHSFARSHIHSHDHRQKIA